MDVGTLTRLVRRALDAALVALIGIVLWTIVFARVIPFATGGVTLVVTGPSMAPAIPMGAAVHAFPVSPERLAVGDVVSLRVGRDQAVFTHRIVRLVPRADGLWIETKGDANPVADPAIIPVSAVLGRVELTIPALGYLITLLAKPEGILFLLGLAGSLVAGIWLLESEEVRPRHPTRRQLVQQARVGPGEPTARRWDR